MQNEIIKYISQYVEVTKELEEALNDSTFARFFPKGTILLSEGEIGNECYFIFKGCIRSYYLEDGEELTTEFYTEGQSATPPCYGKNTPSKIFYECIEDTIATVGTPELEEQMYNKHPKLETLSRVMSNIFIANHQEDFIEFKHASPKQRYLNLLEKRPGLLQRVPLHQIASYLGITPESLSRIRKRTLKD
jgi:CRP-like cAMP-binding protein